jgi:hypothetical protein
LSCLPAGARFRGALPALSANTSDLSKKLRSLAGFGCLAAKTTNLAQVVQTAILDDLPALAADLAVKLGTVFREYRLAAAAAPLSFVGHGRSILPFD